MWQLVVQAYISLTLSEILFFFDHRSLTRNNTQTAVTNTTTKRIVEKQKLHLSTRRFECFDTHLHANFLSFCHLVLLISYLS